MKFALSVLVSILAIVHARSSLAQDGLCGENYCTGKIEYVVVHADGSHYIWINASGAEMQKLTCSPPSTVYIAIGDTPNKNDILSTAMAAYMRGAPVIVYTNPAVDTCQVDEIFLSKILD